MGSAVHLLTSMAGRLRKQHSIHPEKGQIGAL